LFQLGYS